MAAGSAGLTLELKRVLPAPPDVVFRACSDASELAKWWGPNGFTIPSLDFEPRAGESYRIEMQPPEGDRFNLTGEFREVDPPVRLAYTFVWEAARSRRPWRRWSRCRSAISANPRRSP